MHCIHKVYWQKWSNIFLFFGASSPVPLNCSGVPRICSTWGRKPAAAEDRCPVHASLTIGDKCLSSSFSILHTVLKYWKLTQIWGRRFPFFLFTENSCEFHQSGKCFLKSGKPFHTFSLRIPTFSPFFSVNFTLFHHFSRFSPKEFHTFSPRTLSFSPFFSFFPPQFHVSPPFSPELGGSKSDRPTFPD